MAHEHDDGALYKRLPDGGLIRYDPAGDAYSYVRGDLAPPLVQVGARVRLSQQQRREDPGAPVRRLVALAMLDVQERASATGDPTGDVPALASLARLGSDPAAQRALRLPGVTVPEGVSPPPDAPGPEGESAAAILARAAAGAPSPADLWGLAAGLHRLPVAELRRQRAILEAGWGALPFRRAGAVAKLVEHARPGRGSCAHVAHRAARAPGAAAPNVHAALIR